MNIILSYLLGSLLIISISLLGFGIFIKSFRETSCKIQVILAVIIALGAFASHHYLLASVNGLVSMGVIDQVEFFREISETHFLAYRAFGSSFIIYGLSSIFAIFWKQNMN